MAASTWTFGPNGVYTAAWDGSDTLTVTLTASGNPVAIFGGQDVPGMAILQGASRGARADLSAYLAPSSATAETYPRGLNSAYTAVLTSQQSYVSAIPLPAGLPVTTLNTIIGSTAFATVTHGWLALLDSNLVVRAVTADQTSAFGSGSTALSLPATAPYVTTYSGLYYLAVCVTATTMGTLPLGNSPLAGSTTTPPILAGTSTGSLTTPPALLSTMGAVTPNGAVRFYGYTS